MSRPRNRAFPSHLLAAILCLGSFTSPAQPAPKPKAPKSVAGLPPDKALALGERMYREGLLPSGEPMQAVVSNDITIAGTAFTCVSCHLRSGVGSQEGGVVTLPTNDTKLAQPRYWKFPNLSPEERKELRLHYPAARPAYTDETLAHVLRTGQDPGGRDLQNIMPRYDLSDRDMDILTHYLRSLSVRISPGVDDETIRFATVITDEVSKQDQEAMLVSMNNFVARHNQHASGFGNRMYLNIGGQEMSGAYRKLALSVWRLKGAPDTWDRQLQACLDKEPVFALLGGLTTGEWRPIHAFCERQKLPCLFPLTDLPVISRSDWYTLYFSRGYYQEGQAVARYLHSLDDPAPARRVLQIIQAGPEGRDLAAGFRETMQELAQERDPRPGEGTVKDILLAKGEILDAAALRALLESEKPTSVLLWTGAGSFEALASLTDHPGFVFMSARMLGGKVFALPVQARPFTWFTYPYRDPRNEPAVSRYANSLLTGLPVHKPETRISTRTYSMLELLWRGLVELDRNLYRDNLLDRISMLGDHVLPDYLRLSFGPGQRYASKSCFIMQLSGGPSPQLVRKSDWVIH